MSGDSKGQAHIHATGIMLHRGIQELLDLGESNNLIKFPIDLSLFHSQDGTVEVDVLPAGQIRVESSAHLQQGTNPAPHLGMALGRLGDARENLQERALARPVTPDYTDGLAMSYLEGGVPESPESLVHIGRADGPTAQQCACPAKRGQKRIGKRLRQSSVCILLPGDVVLLAKTLCTDDIATHWFPYKTSANVFSIRRNQNAPPTSIVNETRQETKKTGPGVVLAPSMAQRKPSTTPTIGLIPYKARHGSGSRLLG